MRVPRLHQHSDRFVQRNLFLHAALGLLSAGRRFESFCEWLASAPDDANAPAAAWPERPLYAVLGALSLWRKLDDLLGRWANEAGDEARENVTTAGAGPRVPRSVLR